MRASSRVGSGPVRQRRDSGYVLIEVVATLALTVLLLGLSYPTVPAGTTTPRFLALVTASVALLRDARSQAVAHAMPARATFDAARRTLRTGAQTLTIPPDVDVSVVAGGNCPADTVRAEILFRPNGTNCGGALRLGRGQRVVQIRVNWVDGRIDVVEGR